MKNNQKEIILLKDLGMIFATETSRQKRRYGVFKCYCGKEFKATIPDVKNGNTKSCGCYRRKLTIERGKDAIIHGLSRHRLYSTWNNMMARCYNESHERYKDYGDRGIVVCKEWHNITNFINDMYPSFKEGLTLDREDNDLAYGKSNCRWVTNNIQSRNRRLLQVNNKSGYRGVVFHKRNQKFIAQIGVDSRRIHIGSFDTDVEAAKAYDKYVLDNNLEHTRNIIID